MTFLWSAGKRRRAASCVVRRSGARDRWNEARWHAPVTLRTLYRATAKRRGRAVADISAKSLRRRARASRVGRGCASQSYQLIGRGCAATAKFAAVAPGASCRVRFLSPARHAFREFTRSQQRTSAFLFEVTNDYRRVREGLIDTV